MQRFDDGCRVVRGHLQQGESGTVRRPAPLLPISQRRDAHADHASEFRLRLAEIGSHRFHILRLERARAGWWPRPAAHRTELSHTGQQFIEGFGFHWDSSRLLRAPAGLCLQGDYKPLA